MTLLSRPTPADTDAFSQRGHALLRGLTACALLCATACSSSPGDSDGDSGMGGTQSGADTTQTEGPAEGSSGSATQAGSDSAADSTSEGGSDTDAETAADAFFVAIAGLWVAPVTSWTSAGSFPTMNMDVRPAGDRVLFSRVDLNPDNSLRFAFALEERDGETELVYRNGGQFLGLDRDTRTILHSSDPDSGEWRFCAVNGGCEYVDATFTFGESTAGATLDLEVAVFEMRHIEWHATRREERALSGPFPSPPAQEPDAPFPDMPTLTAMAGWTEPLAEPAYLWVVLSTTACGLNPIANCVPSRYLSIEVPAGATEASLVFEQIHAGDYQVNAVLDRNQNLGSGALLPDDGDGVAFPDTPTTVPVRGNGEVALSIVDL